MIRRCFAPGFLPGLVPALLLVATIVPKTAMATASAELYGTQAYLYGRYEARIRFAAGDGVVGSFFLWKVGGDAPGAFWNEVDFEELGSNCHLQSNVIFGNPPSTGREQVYAPDASHCATFHDYRIEWTPAYIAWVVDGQEVRRETGAVALAFSQNATNGMTFHFNIWPGNANFGGVLNPAILPVREFISWVQYSSLVNGAFQLQWREEFDGATLPIGWAAGDWASPFNLSTHTAQNINFVNGIGVLSMTADAATGFTGVPPVDPAAGAGGTGAGGTGTAGAGAGGTGAGGRATGGAGGGGTGAGGTGAGGAGTGGAGVGGTGTGGGGAGGPGVGGTGTDGRGAGGTGIGGNATGVGGTSTGGSGTGAGGTGAAGTGTGGRQAGGSGAVAPVVGAPRNSGCSCQLTGPSDRELGFVWLGMFGLSLLGRRRVSTRARDGQTRLP